MLFRSELAKLTVPAEVYVTHLKPGQVESIIDEIARMDCDVIPQILQNDQVLEF